jgi:hypothetical protein
MGMDELRRALARPGQEIVNALLPEPGGCDPPIALDALPTIPPLAVNLVMRVEFHVLGRNPDCLNACKRERYAVFLQQRPNCGFKLPGVIK